ncbi:MAG: XTP/dITP diphosphatase [Chloroflexi bacterium]|nr:XTP/dITP diphosphatase [Chloroflexota bacterium]
MHTKLLIATHNQGKVREFAHIFADLPLTLLSLDDAGVTWEVEETGATFEANARLKAEAYCRATGLPTLAEDSGLEVDALDGAPGVYSARYGGPGLTPVQRYELLLERMRAIPAGQRQARFRSVIALAAPGRPPQVAEGACPGEIAGTPRGAGGFGYDPVFFMPEFGRTMAELSLEEKNRASHRARAARAAHDKLRAMLDAANPAQ